MAKTIKNSQPKTGMPLHKQVALGAKPKEVVTTKGLNKGKK